MKSQLTALLGSVLLVSSVPLIAGEQPFYTPGMHVVTVADATSREPASLDWTAMIGTGGKSKPFPAGASTSSTALDWTSRIGTGAAAISNSGSKVPVKARVVVARAVSTRNK